MSEGNSSSASLPQHSGFFVARASKHPQPISLAMSHKLQIHWRREDIVHLIELYESNVCLWKVKHQLYKDRNARDASMKKILDNMKNQMPDVTSPDIRNKLHTLRSQYRREMKLVKESMKFGAGIEEIYKPN